MLKVKWFDQEQIVEQYQHFYTTFIRITMTLKKKTKMCQKLNKLKYFLKNRMTPQTLLNE